MADGETFDYVIVGAGSAGCVLANRLSEDPGVSVCLLEAGPPDRSPFIHVPLGMIRTAIDPKINWLFTTVPQDRINGRQVFTPRGKVLGGTSSINGMLYVRGHHGDYDEWAALGNPGWSWPEVKRYFIKSEHNEQIDDEYHGQGGPLNVTFLRTRNPLVEDFIAAAQALQYRRNDDFNGATQDGFGLHQVTQKNGRRWSTVKAYLEPARGRKNLTVVTDAPTERVILDGRRATGVVVAGVGGRRTIAARREVLLAAGSHVSPKLLMLSGIGDAQELKAHGIAPVHHLPGVGKNYQDHVNATMQMKTKSTVPYGISVRSVPRLAWWAVEYLVNRSGLYASNTIEGAGYIRTAPGLPRPDVKITLVTAHRAHPPRTLGYGHGFFLVAALMRPKSRGRVSLASADPNDAPVIDPQFLAEADDLDVLLKGFKEGRRLMHAENFARYRPREIMPGEDVRSDDDLRAFLRATASTSFHPVGTCKMGPDSDPMAVVDARLRVRGVERLRVIDGSIMPIIVGGNTNAPIIMIGERAADLIKEDARA